MARSLAYRLTRISLHPLVLGATLLAAPLAQAAGPDLNGDGIADLVIGMPMDAVGNKQTAGTVGIAYGSLSGPNLSSSQLWNQDSQNIAESTKKGDQFGQVIACGDFNGDGFDDMAVGAAFEDIEQIADGGSVNVLYGSAIGVIAADSQLLHQDKGVILDHVENGDAFGYALAAGDFNGDGFDDLAVGVPNEDYLLFENTGVVQVFFGSAAGLRATGSLWLSRARLGGTNQPDLHLGYALCTGNFNNDAYDDLVVGVPGANQMAGEVVVVRGGPNGIVYSSAQSWTQDSPGVPGDAGTPDSFGMAVAAGDINGDGFSDLAVGIPFDGLHAGAANVIFGSSAGLTGAGSRLLTPGLLGDPTSGWDFSQFGWSLCIADFNHDGFGDLLIGAPFRTVGAVQYAGAVYAIFGAASGLNLTNDIRLTKLMLVSGGIPVEADGFGWSLRAGDFNGDGHDDAAIGVPFEDEGAVDAGMVILLPGGASDFDFLGEQYFTQEDLGVGNTGAVNEAMGFGRGP